MCLELGTADKKRAEAARKRKAPAAEKRPRKKQTPEDKEALKRQRAEVRAAAREAAKRQRAEDRAAAREAAKLAKAEAKAAASSAARGAVVADSSEEEEEEEGEDDEPVACNWAQCDRCEKWRRLPDSSEYEADNLPEQWFCEMNPNAQRNTCDKPEERMVRGERWGEEEGEEEESEEEGEEEGEGEALGSVKSGAAPAARDGLSGVAPPQEAPAAQPMAPAATEAAAGRGVADLAKGEATEDGAAAAAAAGVAELGIRGASGGVSADVEALRERVKARRAKSRADEPQDPRSRLTRHLRLRGFKIKDVPGDNNCQFHAIADQLGQVPLALPSPSPGP